MNHRHPIFCILPPHMLQKIAEKGTPAQRQMAISNLTESAEVRGRREALTNFSVLRVARLVEGKQRVIYDAGQGAALPGRRVRGEGDPATGDAAVDEAYDGAGVTYDLFWEVYGRKSIDAKGMRLDSTVHYKRGYDNAFWNGQQMVYGDGDEDMPEPDRLFNRFTVAVDIIGHELTHGVTQHEAALVYRDQPGSLNESISDVFGALVKQRLLGQTARDADWIIGGGLFTAAINGAGLRSMKEPGTAYDDPILGQDPQPGHMDDYKNVTYDNGGVHINSGIPNRAFYVAAFELNGFAWEKMGKIWYVALRDKLTAASNFQDTANAAFEVAGSLFGSGSLEQQAVRAGWNEVGIQVTAVSNNDNGGDIPQPEPDGCLPTVKALLGF